MPSREAPSTVRAGLRRGCRFCRSVGLKCGLDNFQPGAVNTCIGVSDRCSNRRGTHAGQNLQFLPENTTIYSKGSYRISRKLKRSVFVPNYPSSGSKLRTFGDHIRKKRIDLWLEQKRVAEIIGTDKCTITNWETNRTHPRIDFIPKIIDFMGYVPDGFFQGSSLSEKIRVYRQIHGLSQKELAWQLGIDPSSIRRWEKGKHKPTERMAEKMRLHMES